MSMTLCRTALLTVVAVAWTTVLEAKTPVSERETMKESLAFEGADSARRLVVDNLNGSILVTGANIETVEMVATRTLSASSASRLAVARSEVKLEIVRDGSAIEIIVDGPFRCDCPEYADREERRWSREWRDPGYEVDYDFELRVPRRIDLELRTVNRGDITVRGVEGEFLLSNVNGGVEASRITGSGRASTVNGPIDVAFLETPPADSHFETVNGEVVLRFPERLSADFDLSTWMGEMFSEFPVTALAQTPPTVEREDGRTVIRSTLGSAVRVGRGGARISVETLNGNVYLRKSEK